MEGYLLAVSDLSITLREEICAKSNFFHSNFFSNKFFPYGNIDWIYPNV